MPTAQLTMECNPIEVDGKWWVDVSLNNRKMKRRGPFPNADKAKAEADRIIREWTPALPATTNATVVLHGKPTELNSDLGRKFIVDAVRAAEGLQKDDELRAKYEISPSDLKKIAENTAVIALSATSAHAVCATAKPHEKRHSSGLSNHRRSWTRSCPTSRQIRDTGSRRRAN